MEKERGFTLIGIIFILMLVVMGALVGFKIVPVYMDYYTVRHTLENVLETDGNQSNEALRSAFEKRLDVNFIREITAKDLVIERDDGKLTLTVSINRKAHLAGGVSLCVDLDATASTAQKN